MTPRVPLYDLRTVQDLAKAQKVSYSRTTQRDIADLGYSSLHAEECIAWLDESEFNNVREFDGTGKFDSYLTRHRGPDGVMRTIYVKLKIFRPTPSGDDELFVTSFHTPKPIL